MKDLKLYPNTRIGRVHLRTADLERVVAFYCNVPGFTVAAHGSDFSLPGAVFLAAGSYRHHIRSKQSNHRRRISSE